MSNATIPDLDALARQVQHLGTGPLARLRRLDPQRADTWPTDFWKLFSAHIEPLLGEEATTELVQRRWATILGAFAQVDPGGPHPGTALAQVGYSELRLNRLLSARDDRLLDEFRAAARFLAAKKMPVDVGQLARLVLYDPDSSAGDGVRRHLAGAYFRTLTAQAK